MGHVWDKFCTFSRYVLDLFQICLGPVSDMFGTFLKHVFDIIEQIWDKFSICLGQV